MKKAGARDEAAAVAKLRRPTVAAWAVNVAARARPDLVAELLSAGDRLRDAQAAALQGDAAALRTATEARRKAVAALVAEAAEALGDRAPAQAGAVSATFEAATVDPEVGELVRAGRLDRERSAAAAGFGFGDVADWTPPPPRERPAREPAPAKPSRLKVVDPKKAPAPEKPAPEKPAPKKKAPDTKLREQLDKAVAEAKRHAAELHDAEATVARLKKELAEATRAVREVRTRTNRAELHAEQLRQRAWEEGERSRR